MTDYSQWKVDDKSGGLYRRIEGKGLCIVEEFPHAPKWWFGLPRFLPIPLRRRLGRFIVKAGWGVWIDVDLWKGNGQTSYNMAAHFETKDQAIDFAEKAVK